MPDPCDLGETWEKLPRARQLALICDVIGDRHDVPVAIIRRGRPGHRGTSKARMYAIRLAYELVEPYTTADLSRDFHMDLTAALQSKQKCRALPRAAELTEIMDGIAGRLKSALDKQ